MADYNPNKQYQWKEEDKFAMNGNQFGLILNAFRQYLTKPEVQEVLLIVKAEAAMTDLLKDGVESGMVKEMLPDSPNQETKNSKGNSIRKLTKAE